MMTFKSPEGREVERSVVNHVEILDDCDELFDITVADNHNFFSGDPASMKLTLSHNCAADVIHLIAIRKKQLVRASHQTIAGKPYKPYFLRHMRYIMGETEHQLSRLRECGSSVDVKYLRHLVSAKSPLVTQMHDIEQDFFALPKVVAANKALLGASGYRGMGLWSNSESIGTGSNWIFTLSKPAHKKELFFNQLGLEAVSVTPKGEPAIDADFIDHYRSMVEEVNTYAEHQEISKLHSTYARGWLKRLRTTKDGVTDYCLRPDYSYMSVQSGRLASYDPSLQVIPQHGKTAKTVKRTFIARLGELTIQFDFSAHEIRFWAICAVDNALAEAFRVGQKLRQQYLNDPTEETLKRIKTEGDLHIQNIFRFFGKWVDKKDPLRDAIKRIVFGTLYGKAVKTLGQDVKLNDINEIKAKIKALHDERKRLLKS